MRFWVIALCDGIELVIRDIVGAHLIGLLRLTFFFIVLLY